MSKFLYAVAFVLLYGYIGLEFVRQADAGMNNESMITIPVELDGVSLYTPKVYDPDDPEVICLAENLFHEARGEGEEGKRAVALVTLNRVAHAHYSNTVCEVVHEPWQFSWTHQNVRINLDNPIERKAWKRSKEIALKALNRGYINDMLGVTHYHATSVNPNWNKRQVAQVGNHVFYMGR